MEARVVNSFLGLPRGARIHCESVAGAQEVARKFHIPCFRLWRVRGESGLWIEPLDCATDFSADNAVLEAGYQAD